MGGSLGQRTLAAACLLSAGFASAQGVDPVPPEQLFERLAPSVWTVETFDGTHRPLAMGSAVVVGPGSLVTNCHVLAKASRVLVARDNVSYGATLEHPDPERDLCLLKVRNFTAPAVTIGNVDGLKTGSRVYAIGSPRGLEQTISDGLLSGMRRSASGDFTALQITVPISHGSSGGGLFDAYGRLIGITTFGLKDAQNLNFALPATWIAEVPQRAKDALATRGTAVASTAVASSGELTPGRTFEYRLTDRLTNTVRTVSYRVDRVDGDRIIINNGAMVQNRRGEVVEIRSAAAGEADAAMPPGGWVRAATEPGASWHATYRNKLTAPPIGMDIDARAVRREELQLAGQRLDTVRVEYTGFTTRGFDYPCGGAYNATAWYAPALARIVRFDVQTQGCSMASKFVIDEMLELTGIY